MVHEIINKPSSYKEPSLTVLTDHTDVMSSEHVTLLRRPLPPIKTTHSCRTLPVPKTAGCDDFSERTFHEDFDPRARRVAPITRPAIMNGFPRQHQRTAAKVTLLHDPCRPPPLFCLNDFLRVGQSEEELRRTVLSRCNYKKLVDLFLLELHRGRQSEVTNQILSCEGFPPIKHTTPYRQIICGMDDFFVELTFLSFGILLMLDEVLKDLAYLLNVFFECGEIDQGNGNRGLTPEMLADAELELVASVSVDGVVVYVGRRDCTNSSAREVVKSSVTRRRLGNFELAARIQLEAQAQTSFRRNSGIRGLSGSQQDTSVDQLWMSTETHTVQSYTAHEVLLNSVTSSHFQGSRRTRSPFRGGGECDIISPSELAVLDCLTRGGLSLSFKAHFLSDLPDVSPVTASLQYLNVSFNDLTRVPLEVCGLTELQVLKMRDNPIQQISDQINKLHKLKTLVISFCKLTHLPKELYSLQCLQYLDVSYNLITSLSSDISNLRSLRSLNVEGNQLVAVPAALLCVSLSELKLCGNFTHTLLWDENSRNSPQTLLHMATHTLAHTHTERRYNSLPHAAQTQLNRAGVCDGCKGLMFGPGLKLIRAVHGTFGLQFVPVMFFCCSPSCLKSFRSQTHKLTED
ncbi:uncharacterized protein LOC127448052 [Myxocyprinus asiaticus]|uniref:uncharacterized protein LOC127448052 n=1 Tax=Myxocyprinus asiaticus TaxID=70543 RepID=UPI002222CCF9|nr:uncharacterized protein LOC127448052 [Myxocyprinus asiaticus]